MKHFISLFCALAFASLLTAQPNQPVPKAKLLQLTGNFEKASLSKDIRILWLYGPEDHRGGEHDYIRVKELFVPLLKKIPRVSVDEAYQFPSQAQFDKADLLIQFLHQPAITDKQFASYQKFVDDGGGVVSITSPVSFDPLTGPISWLAASVAPGKATKTPAGVSSAATNRSSSTPSTRSLPACPRAYASMTNRIGT